MAVNIVVRAVSRAIVVLLLIPLCTSNALAQSPRLSLEDGTIWVKNLDPDVLYTFQRYFNSQEDWQSVFPVATKGSVNGILVSGTYDIFNDAIRFTPRFPFAQHVVYLAKFDAEQLAHNTNEVYLPMMQPDYLELEFSFSKPTQAPPELIAIYPSSNTLPENLLRFYLTFSKSMTQGEIYSRVKLLNREGKEVEKPFLIVDQELWDDQMKTVTILFDPGRIKRGLRPNLEMKPALTEGEQYTLIVQSGWKDIDGLPTRQEYSKVFRSVKADRTSPSASAYEIIAPQFETSSLIINMKESLDYILLMNCIKIFDDTGNPVEGTTIVRNSESSIEFVPKTPWFSSEYTIQINPLLEDLAGNNLNRLFDEDMVSLSSKGKAIHQLNFKFSKPAH